MADAMADRLLKDVARPVKGASDAVSFEGVWIVVPTRRAARRLRSRLAAARPVLDVCVRLPADLLTGALEGAETATRTIEKEAWMEVLEDADLRSYSGLFPFAPSDRELPWSLSAAGMIQQLRETLLEAGLSIGRVVKERSDRLEEPDRWRDLARLEAEWQAELTRRGLEDRCERMLSGMDQPNLPGEVERVILAGVPDLSPLCERVLRASGRRVEVWIHAPALRAEAFDDWGRPLPDAWSGPLDHWPVHPDDLQSAGTPEQQARRVLRVMEEAVGRGRTADDLALGAFDDDTLDATRRALEAHGLMAYDPQPLPLKSHPMARLLLCWGDVLQERTYTALSRLFRHPDWMAFMERQAAGDSLSILRELDTLQQDHLPQRTDDVTRPFKSAVTRRRYPALRAALEIWQIRLHMFENEGYASAARKLLAAVYAERRAGDEEAPSEEDRSAASALNDLLDEFERSETAVGGDAVRAAGLFGARVAEETYPGARPETALDLEGWMELFWQDAPWVVASGMNEGAVPESRVSDVFVPDALRGELGLMDDRRRLARDAYMLSSITASRRDRGRTVLVCGKTSATGDPLKPSRLLFLCPDEELAGRAAPLFETATLEAAEEPPTCTVKLNPSPPDDVNAYRARLTHLSVTAFRDYLKCPFRFYLKHVLEMEPLDDRKQEPDALDFGSMIHTAWEHFGRHETVRASEDEEAIAAALCDAVDAWIRRQYGSEPTLPVRYVGRAAHQRLTAAARVQASLAREGWEILSAEESLSMEIDGVTVRGKIDRIDRHRETGALRVIDYKTSDKGEPPVDTHWRPARKETPDYERVDLGKKTYRWTDLQLPLYLLLLRENDRDIEGAVPGYFVLPKASTQADVLLWDGLKDEAMERAEVCVKEIVRRVRERQFWPPNSVSGRDDFEFLLGHGPVEELVDVEAFAAYTGGDT